MCQTPGMTIDLRSIRVCVIDECKEMIPCEMKK